MWLLPSIVWSISASLVDVHCCDWKPLIEIMWMYGWQLDPLRETLESLVSNDGDEDVVDLGAGRDDGVGINAIFLLL